MYYFTLERKRFISRDRKRSPKENLTGIETSLPEFMILTSLLAKEMKDKNI